MLQPRDESIGAAISNLVFAGAPHLPQQRIDVIQAFGRIQIHSSALNLRELERQSPCEAPERSLGDGRRIPVFLVQG